jgi:hypothetical protein
MTPFLSALHSLAALRGEGLRPELVKLLERSKPAEASERKDRHAADASKVPVSSAA